MPSIEGIDFDEKSVFLVKELIEELKSLGYFEVYGLPAMHHGRGEVRFAHRAPKNSKHSKKKAKARGVFAHIYAAQNGATFIPRRRLVPGSRRILLSKEAFPEILAVIQTSMNKSKFPVTVSEKVDPNPPGTLQGGQFESNRRKF